MAMRCNDVCASYQHFAKVSFTVIWHRQFNNELTLQNFYLRWRETAVENLSASCHTREGRV